jgi:hypothetical protein
MYHSTYHSGRCLAAELTRDSVVRELFESQLRVLSLISSVECSALLRLERDEFWDCRASLKLCVFCAVILEAKARKSDCLNCIVMKMLRITSFEM